MDSENEIKLTYGIIENLSNYNDITTLLSYEDGEADLVKALDKFTEEKRKIDSDNNVNLMLDYLLNIKSIIITLRKVLENIRVTEKTKQKIDSFIKENEISYKQFSENNSKELQSLKAIQDIQDHCQKLAGNDSKAFVITSCILLILEEWINKGSLGAIFTLLEIMKYLCDNNYCGEKLTELFGKKIGKKIPSEEEIRKNISNFIGKIFEDKNQYNIEKEAEICAHSLIEKSQKDLLDEIKKEISTICVHQQAESRYWKYSAITASFILLKDISRLTKLDANKEGNEETLRKLLSIPALELALFVQSLGQEHKGDYLICKNAKLYE